MVYLAHARDSSEEHQEHQKPREDETQTQMPLQMVALVIVESFRNVEHEIAARKIFM